LQNQTEEGDKQLQQARDQNVKLGLKYERIIAEVEACHEHTVDLKAIIIEKVNTKESIRDVFLAYSYFLFITLYSSHTE
jgi:hypothetical protein